MKIIRDFLQDRKIRETIESGTREIVEIAKRAVSEHDLSLIQQAQIKFRNLKSYVAKVDSKNKYLGKFEEGREDGLPFLLLRMEMEIYRRLPRDPEITQQINASLGEEYTQ